MYKLQDITGLIEKPEQYYAHTSDYKAPELLTEHLILTIKYYDKLCAKKNIAKLVQNLIASLGIEPGVLTEKQELIYDMFVNAIYLHDIGKIKPAFQRNKMKNPYFSDSKDNNDDNHGPLSALIYIEMYYDQIASIEAKKDKKILYYILFSFAYAILKHHGRLTDTQYFLERSLGAIEITGGYLSFPSRDYEKLQKIYLQYQNNKYIDGVNFYILSKLLYSLIVSCDYYATYEYKLGEQVEIGVIEDIDGLIKQYHMSEIYTGINQYKQNAGYFKQTPINALRSDIFLEAEKNLISNSKENIFYLEAPTGGGKTNTSINLALNLLKQDNSLKNILYIFPFNTLSEQTEATFAKYFKRHQDFATINSITPIYVNDKEDVKHIDYDKAYIDNQFMHYSICLTSHIKLFNALFGTAKDANLLLTRLCSSVVILDEIQSYRNDIWRSIILFLDRYAKMLNIKIIIMSATLPKLDKLLLQDTACSFVNLIENTQKYYEHPLFKNRVLLDFSLLDLKLNENELFKLLCEKIKQYKGKKILIEFIKKTTARRFYNFITTEIADTEIIELTGDDNKYFRNSALKKIKTLKDIIVVATQVIEAGIDIDMDIGFKDISIFDSEEQFLGRLNRSCLKNYECKAYFFNYDEAKGIYKNDNRLEHNLSNENIRTLLLAKQFDQFYNLVFEKIIKNTSQYNSRNIQKYIEDVCKLDFAKTEENMRLIADNTWQLFLAFSLEVDGEVYDGKQVWQEYKLLLENDDIGYAEKKIKLTYLYEKMSYFTYSVFANKFTKPGFYTEEYGGYYYVDNGENFIIDGKFDRGKYTKMAQGCIW